MSITIGPARIADADGTHEPGAILEQPSAALIVLAAARTCDPESGLPYAVLTELSPPPAAALAPAFEPDPEPELEPVAEATPATEAAP